MNPKLICEFLGIQLNAIYTKSFPTGDFQCRNHIGISRDEDDGVNVFANRHTSNINTNPKVHTFLLNVRLDVISTYGDGRL